MATVNERLRDEAIAHTVWISRYSTGLANRMVKLLNDSDAELTARLLVAMDSLPTSQFTVARLESLLGSVRELNQQAIAGMQTSLADELLQLAGHEAGYQLSLFDALLPQQVKERYPLQGIMPEQLYAAAMAQPFQGRLLSEWADNLEAALSIQCAVATYWVIPRRRSPGRCAGSPAKAIRTGRCSSAGPMPPVLPKRL